MNALRPLPSRPCPHPDLDRHPNLARGKTWTAGPTRQDQRPTPSLFPAVSRVCKVLACATCQPNGPCRVATPLYVSPTDEKVNNHKLLCEAEQTYHLELM
jgi:hypothetical protein